VANKATISATSAIKIVVLLIFSPFSWWTLGPALADACLLIATKSVTKESFQKHFVANFRESDKGEGRRLPILPTPRVYRASAPREYVREEAADSAANSTADHIDDFVTDSTTGSTAYRTSDGMADSRMFRYTDQEPVAVAHRA
jgi:hypothetical protein